LSSSHGAADIAPTPRSPAGGWGAGGVFALVGHVALLGLEVFAEHGPPALVFGIKVGAHADLEAARRRQQGRAAQKAGLALAGTVPNTPRASSEWSRVRR